MITPDGSAYTAMSEDSAVEREAARRRLEATLTELGDRRAAEKAAAAVVVSGPPASLEQLAQHARLGSEERARRNRRRQQHSLLEPGWDADEGYRCGDVCDT